MVKDSGYDGFAITGTGAERVCGDQVLPHGHNDRPGSHRAQPVCVHGRAVDTIRRRNRPAYPGTLRPRIWPSVTAANGAGFLDRFGHFSRPFEPTGLFDRLIVRVLEGDMSERRITQLFGLILGGLFTFGLVLNAFAF